jgi:pyruvate/2-oxoglutarate dehydrogenase complex dihydrolipoamide dehydrogenase (E3) component
MPSQLLRTALSTKGPQIACLNRLVKSIRNYTSFPQNQAWHSVMASQTPKMYDAIVIGSGQSGSPLATTLQKAGKNTAMIEATHCGGCCINEGCTPTKTLIASGRIAYLARRAADYGVHNGGPITVDMQKVRQRKRDIVQSWEAGSRKRLTDGGVDLMMGRAEFVEEKTIRVKLNDGGEVTVKAELVFVNVGERPAIPKLEGLDEVIKQMPDRILDSTSVQELGEVPQGLIVLGGGVIGLEFAQLLSRLGAKVDIVQRNERLMPREDPDLSEAMKEMMEGEGVKVRCSTQALKISSSDKSSLTLSIRSSAGDAELKGSHVLLAVGRQPNTDTLNLSATGVTLNKRGYVEVNEFLETNVKGIYALGDCKGPPAFTHVSYDDFRIVRDNLDLLLHPSASQLDRPIKPHSTEVRKRTTPAVTYTDPQFGHVGLRLHEIPADQRKNIKIAKMPMSYVARAIETDETRGLMKAVVNGETGEILGYSCLGIEGGELMAVVQMAMIGNVKWWQLREAVWAHPSLAESLNNLWGYLEDAP